MRESNAGSDAYSEIYEKAAENVRRYTEREPTQFEEWVKENKASFA
jgi:hypothetical protein